MATFCYGNRWTIIWYIYRTVLWFASTFKSVCPCFDSVWVLFILNRTSTAFVMPTKTSWFFFGFVGSVLESIWGFSYILKLSFYSVVLIVWPSFQLHFQRMSTVNPPSSGMTQENRGKMTVRFSCRLMQQLEWPFFWFSYWKNAYSHHFVGIRWKFVHIFAVHININRSWFCLHLISIQGIAFDEYMIKCWMNHFDKKKTEWK